eukprot:m.216014 g.216014  ORF g.216014 m.216014 type:complete len:134 (-) comp15545_c0_seq4:2458-2859(-)
MASINMTISASVMSMNAYGIAVLLLHRHITALMIARRQHIQAAQGWIRVQHQRERAVACITMALPGMLVTSAFFVIADTEVRPLNWLSFSMLIIAAVVVLHVILTMEADFTCAHDAGTDVRPLFAWSKASSQS